MAKKKAVKVCKGCGEPAPTGYHLNYKWYCDLCYERELSKTQLIPDDPTLYEKRQRAEDEDWD